jgi:hypothetical protein
MNKDWRTSDFYKQSFELVLLCFSMIWLLGGVWGISVHRLVADGKDSLPLSLIYLVFSLLLALLPIGIIRSWLLRLPTNMTSNKFNDTIDASASVNPELPQNSTHVRNDTVKYPRAKGIKKPNNYLFPDILPPSEADKDKKEHKPDKAI